MTVVALTSDGGDNSQIQSLQYETGKRHANPTVGEVGLRGTVQVNKGVGIIRMMRYLISLWSIASIASLTRGLEHLIQTVTALAPVGSNSSGNARGSESQRSRHPMST